MEAKPTKKKILLVEDDSFLADIYKTSIENSGIEVTYAKDGAEAIKEMIERQFDLIVLDLLLPKMDGFEILKKAKENIRFLNTPIIVLSNLTGEDDIEKALSLGAKDYFIKTRFEPKDIVKKIKTILNPSQ